MKYKPAINLLLIALSFYYTLKYFILKSEAVLFYGLITFSLLFFISMVIYIVLFFDFKLKLRYVSLNEVSEETKDKIINKLQAEKEKIKQELKKFKNFWYSIMGHFHKRICYDKNENYKIVSDDLYKNGIFDNNDNEIANNIYRKVTMPNENKTEKNRKKNDTRF